MTQQSKLQTPRAAVSHLGSARSGTQHAWRQRLTSFALLPLTIAFVAILVSLAGRDYESARALLGSPCPAILLILFIAAGAWHMALGLQVVIEDYIPSEHAKTLALMANSVFSAVIGLAGVYAVLRLSFT
jgi:succinate dehydrogenase / fumarate reductase membrane anchor subunit